ncbi:sulfotransferase family protein [Chthonobacter rhizosphaerae]|uniref:sulfotransferase family protein n=1 Tax=Chthonobacter rhizosphaerae TaxID=2735553 RepID=UPI0015EFD6CC|nr:sulfotransferase [Chthonobacter rhizosphaerae]
MKPDTFIIGAPKTGTSALAHYLAAHENVFFCVPKEPFYWCSDFPRLKHEMSLRDLDDYLALFRKADPARHTVVAEGSTRYLRSTVAVANILAFNPAAKFIAMLRNPVDLAPAYHMEQRYSLHEDIVSFEDAWRAQEARARGDRIPKACREPAFLQYGEVASLGAQVARLRRLAPADQVRIIVFDDFKSDPGRVYRETLAFLGLPDDGRTRFETVNSAHGHRYEWLAKAVLTPPAILERPVLRLRRHLWENRYPPVEWIKKRLNQRKDREPISPGLKAEMMAYFRADVELLSNELGRDLTHWVRPG